jgi:alginate O-acetyltransferase complex protein AlgI
MWITMLISGLWHGAAWTYIAWGGIHAFFLSLERILGWPTVFNKSKILLKVAAWLLVTVQVLVAWVFFRAESMGQAIEIIKTMFAFTGPINPGWGLNDTLFISIMIIRELIVALGIKDRINWDSKKWMWLEVFLYAVLITAVIYFRGTGSEFIYFQF